MHLSLLLLLLAGLVAGQAVDPSSSSKLSPAVASHVLAASTVESLVVEFAAVPSFDTRALAALSRPDRLANITRQLQTTAKQSQGRVLQLILDAMAEDPTVSAQSYFIANRIFLSHSTSSVIAAIAADPAVSLVRKAIPDGSLLGFVSPAVAQDTRAVPGSTNAWPVDRIGAPSAWRRGVRGANVVVGTIDSGVRHTHVSLNATFRSDHGWYDATEGTSSARPIDYGGHGTAVTAAAVGGGRGQRGVAPAASWMACAACRDCGCSERALTACAQFMLCPSSVHGSTKECGLAPHVIVNGWHTQDADWFTPMLAAWKLGGIVAVFGSGVARQLVDGVDPQQCGTVAGPASSEFALAVAPTTDNDAVTSYTRFGPTQDGRVKPDVAAPGDAVSTADATADDAYVVRSGASLAAAYTGGAVALYLSAYPNATYEDIFRALTTSAARTKSVGLRCGGLPDDTFPNNVAGAGRLDIALALDGALGPRTNQTTTKLPSPTTSTTTTLRPTTTRRPTTPAATTRAPSNGTETRNTTVAPADTIVFVNTEA